MVDKAIALARDIFDSQIDNAKITEEYIAWCDARDIFEYALVGNVSALAQYKFLSKKEK